MRADWVHRFFRGLSLLRFRPVVWVALRIAYGRPITMVLWGHRGWWHYSPQLGRTEFLEPPYVDEQTRAKALASINFEPDADGVR